MTTFALIHGGGDVGWYWHLVEAELRAGGHATFAPDLPIEDNRADLHTFADTVIAAIGPAQHDVVVVGHSFGGYVAPIVAQRIGARAIVLVAGMIPQPGETAEQMFARTGWESPPGDTRALFYHDVPDALADEAMRRSRHHAPTSGQHPWPLSAWPAIPTRYVLGTQDRFFPAAWVRKVVADRLGITPDEIDASHCMALSRPRELATLLAAT